MLWVTDKQREMTMMDQNASAGQEVNEWLLLGVQPQFATFCSLQKSVRRRDQWSWLRQLSGCLPPSLICLSAYAFFPPPHLDGSTLWVGHKRMFLSLFSQVFSSPPDSSILTALYCRQQWILWRLPDIFCPHKVASKETELSFFQGHQGAELMDATVTSQSMAFEFESSAATKLKVFHFFFKGKLFSARRVAFITALLPFVGCNFF